MDDDEFPPASPGQLWQAADVAGVLYVADAVIEDPIIAAHPVSLEIRYLSGEDVRLEAHETPLGVQAMIEAWHFLPVDRAALGRFLGEVPEEVLRTVARFRAGTATQADRDARSGAGLPPDPGHVIEAFWHREMGYWKPAGARALALMLSIDPGQEEAAAMDAPRGFVGPAADNSRKGFTS